MILDLKEGCYRYRVWNSWIDWCSLGSHSGHLDITGLDIIDGNDAFEIGDYLFENRLYISSTHIEFQNAALVFFFHFTVVSPVNQVAKRGTAEFAQPVLTNTISSKRNPRICFQMPETFLVDKWKATFEVAPGVEYSKGAQARGYA